jgi:hypothetical protein
MSKRTIANNKIDLSGNDFKLPTAENVTFGTSTLGNILTGKVNVASPSFTGNVGIGTTAPRVALDIVSTGAILLPAGTTTQQPGGIKGLIRYNTTTNVFEGFSGAAGAWSQIGGSVANTVSITGVSFSANSFIVQTDNTSGTLGVHLTLVDEWSTGTNFITLHSAVYNTTNNTFKLWLTNSYKGTVITINSTYDNLQYNIILTKGREIVNSGLYRFDITGYVERIALNPYITSEGRLIKYRDAGTETYYYDNNNYRSVTTGGYSLCRLFTEYNGPTIRVINSRDGLTYDIWFNEEFEPLKAKSSNTFINFGSTYTLEIWRNGGILSVTTWYGQGSVANNLTQTDPTKQPILEFDTVLGSYAVKFNSSDVLTATNGFVGGQTQDRMMFYTRVREITRTENVVAISYNGNTAPTFGAIISGANGITWNAGGLGILTLSGSTEGAINISGTSSSLYNAAVRLDRTSPNTTVSSVPPIGSTAPTCSGGLRIGSGYIGYFKYLITTTYPMVNTYYNNGAGGGSYDDYELQPTDIFSKLT